MHRRRRRWRRVSQEGPNVDLHPQPQPKVCLASKSDFGKEVGANDEVLIASRATTTSATTLQWRWASTWCSTRWWRWPSRRSLWWIPRKCQAAGMTKLIVSLKLVVICIISVLFR